jgi:hypothetical protein
VLEDYLTFRKLDEGWQEVLELYNIDLLFLTNKASLQYQSYLTKNGWNRTFEGPLASIFERKTP